jgi:uncharacterized membrane protein
MLPYRLRLARDLERWQASGWVSAEHAALIRADGERRRSGPGLATALATLGAVLIGFAAMSFVAANWQEMSKLARLATIFGALWTLLALAGLLFARGLAAFGHSALLAATAIYGAGIMLIAQMYHMDGHPPDAVLWWGLGTLIAGVLTFSNPTLGAALVLFATWSLMEMLDFSGAGSRIHWAFLPAWAATAAGFAATRWRPGLHLVAIALSGWIVISGYMIGRGQSATAHTVVTAVGAALIAASMLGGEMIDRWRRISGAMLAYGMAIAFAGLMALQFVVDAKGERTLLLGGTALAGIVAMLAWAWRSENRPALWLAYCAFSIEIFSLYLKKIGTLLGTSAFFLVTGLVVSALAFLAWRLHGRTLAPQEVAR